MAVREEVSLVARNEIRKNLRSTKGIVMFVFFMLGGMLPTVGSIILNNMLKSAGGKEKGARAAEAVGTQPGQRCVSKQAGASMDVGPGNRPESSRGLKEPAVGAEPFSARLP